VAVHRILAAHLDVSTQRDGINAVVGFAFAEAEQALAETDYRINATATSEMSTEFNIGD
jgi:hypothetical protein